jgi:hypothetical protein
MQLSWDVCSSEGMFVAHRVRLVAQKVTSIEHGVMYIAQLMIPEVVLANRKITVTC